jgi:hypothetical protein
MPFIAYIMNDGILLNVKKLLFAALALAAAITYSHAKVGDTAPPNRLTGFTKSASNFEIAD